jgi:hypothetical protein
VWVLPPLVTTVDAVGATVGNDDDDNDDNVGADDDDDDEDDDDSDDGAAARSVAGYGSGLYGFTRRGDRPAAEARACRVCAKKARSASKESVVLLL